MSVSPMRAGSSLSCAIGGQASAATSLNASQESMLLTVDADMSSRLTARKFSRRRASTAAAVRRTATVDGKPPNVLIYAPVGDAGRLTAAVRAHVTPDAYTVYTLSLAQLLHDPWLDNAACLLVADTRTLDDAAWARLYAYFEQGGRLLFLCRNALLVSLAECRSQRKRQKLVRLARSTTQLADDFEQFMCRLSKQLDQKHMRLQQTSRDATTGRAYTMCAVRDKGAPLLLYLVDVTQQGVRSAGLPLRPQGNNMNAQAVFTDATLDALLSRSLVLRDALDRLGLSLKELAMTPTADAASTPQQQCCTPAYLLYTHEHAGRYAGLVEAESVAVLTQGRSAFRVHSHSQASSIRRRRRARCRCAFATSTARSRTSRSWSVWLPTVARCRSCTAAGGARCAPLTMISMSPT